MSRNQEGLQGRNFQQQYCGLVYLLLTMAFLEFDIQLRCYSKIVDLSFGVWMFIIDVG